MGFFEVFQDAPNFTMTSYLRHTAWILFSKTSFGVFNILISPLLGALLFLYDPSLQTNPKKVFLGKRLNIILATCPAHLNWCRQNQLVRFLLSSAMSCSMLSIHSAMVWIDLAWKLSVLHKVFFPLSISILQHREELSRWASHTQVPLSYKTLSSMRRGAFGVPQMLFLPFLSRHRQQFY